MISVSKLRRQKFVNRKDNLVYLVYHPTNVTLLYVDVCR